MMRYVVALSVPCSVRPVICPSRAEYISFVSQEYRMDFDDISGG